MFRRYGKIWERHPLIPDHPGIPQQPPGPAASARQTDSGLTFRRRIFIKNKHYFFEVELLRFMLQTRLLPPNSICFRLHFPGPNVKIRRLVSEDGRLKDDYLVKIDDIPTVNVCDL